MPSYAVPLTKEQYEIISKDPEWFKREIERRLGVKCQEFFEAEGRELGYELIGEWEPPLKT